jgi:predicted acyltransferase
MAQTSPAPSRLVSMDAYRGFVMFLMMAEVLRLSAVARATGSGFWQFLAWNQSHVAWYGMSLHDTIQPGFSFLVGVALPYSLASRMAKGQSTGTMYLHAAWRAVALTLLGVFLRSVGRAQTNWTFEDTLSQIGLGYVFLFALGFRSMRTIAISLGLILVGYWAAFVLYPLPPVVPPVPVDPAVLQVTPAVVPEPSPYPRTGLAAHFNKNTNLAWAFDAWFLNLFPRAKPFVANGGGYSTLSFIPTLGTMILGLIAGRWLREKSRTESLRYLLIAGVAGIALGTALHYAGIVPAVKRIWTPGWTILSGGVCFLFLAAFYYVIDFKGWTAWAFPLVVIGMNSIAIYVMVHLWDGFILGSFRTHFGKGIFEIAGPYESLFSGGTLLLVYWLILYWMYRRKLFLRI